MLPFEFYTMNKWAVCSTRSRTVEGWGGSLLCSGLTSGSYPGITSCGNSRDQTRVGCVQYKRFKPCSFSLNLGLYFALRTCILSWTPILSLNILCFIQEIFDKCLLCGRHKPVAKHQEVSKNIRSSSRTLGLPLVKLLAREADFK